ncbi:MAG: DUF2752 domain-containing protein [Myxococcota bacterium]
MRRLEWHRWLPWVLGGGAVAVVFALGTPICPTRRVLGLPCPGCGMTRATAELLTLDFASAGSHHPLVFLVVPLVGWTIVASVTGAERAKLPPTWLWIATAIALVAVWVVRVTVGDHPDL